MTNSHIITDQENGGIIFARPGRPHIGLTFRPSSPNIMLLSHVTGVRLGIARANDLKDALVYYSTRLPVLLSASLYLVREALIEIGCVVTSLVVGWLSHACTVAKRCILGL